MIQKIISKGKLVYRHRWDGGCPTGGGIWSIYQLDNMFAFDCDGFGDNEGPYESLEQAIEANELYDVTAATISIECPSLTAEELANRLKIFAEDPFVATINGEKWQFSPNGIRHRLIVFRKSNRKA